LTYTVTGLLSYVLGIYALGEVNKNDMETVLLPLLDDLAGLTGNFNYLLILKTRYKFHVGRMVE